jgi:outer membrane protein
MNARLLPLVASLSLLVSLPSRAESLMHWFEAARAYDAGFRSAQALVQANERRADQAQAGLRPSVNLSLGVNKSQTGLIPDGPAQASVAADRDYGSSSATLSAAQPLYRPANRRTAEIAELQRQQARLQLQAAEQDLMIRVTQAYFDVLASQDTLTFVRAQKQSVTEQLASAKRNFEVGTATITDTREAQARFDLVLAQEIAAQNDVQVKQLALDQLVGQTQAKPNRLQTQAALASLNTQPENEWVKLALAHQTGVIKARLDLQIAKQEVEKAKAANWPTLDLQATSNATHFVNGSASSATLSAKSITNTLGLVMNYPLYAGGAITARSLETAALLNKAEADLQALERNATQSTRATYYALQSVLAQVKALEAAEQSSQVALDANKLGYSVGVRINIDVLNAQSQLFDTKAKLAKARYDVILTTLKLKLAAGVLSVQDIEAINRLIAS